MISYFDLHPTPRQPIFTRTLGRVFLFFFGYFVNCPKLAKKLLKSPILFRCSQCRYIVLMISFHTPRILISTPKVNGFSVTLFDRISSGDTDATRVVSAQQREQEYLAPRCGLRQIILRLTSTYQRKFCFLSTYFSRERLLPRTML